MSVHATDPLAASRLSPFGGVLVSTKLHVPEPRPELVARDRLYATLSGAGPRKLTVVEAPAGSGKTTLIAQWQESAFESRPFAWVSLDEGDNDPSQFWTYLVEALRTVDPELGAGTLALLRTRREDVLDLALPALINELAALHGQLVLVLEDYHAIAERDVHDQLTWLLDHLPPTLEIALTTRVDPPLHLARLRARGELVHVRAGELRFSVEEAGAMLAGLHLELDPADVALLHERTEGWAAGLYLAALSLRGRDDAHHFIETFTGDDRHLVDYLAGEVLEEQPAEIGRFLLRTSVLRRMCAPLCDALTGESSSHALLGEIERSNLFLVPLDNRREWYRYHHLFGQLLERELERTEGELVPELHRRASAWLRAEGHVGDAIHHAVLAGDLDAASDLIAEHWNGYFNHGRLATVRTWLDSLPTVTVQRDRRLAVARAWVALDLGRLEEATRWTTAAELAEGPGLEPETALLAAVCRFKGGELGAAEAAAARAAALAPEPLSFPGTVARCILGIALQMSGRADEAMRPLYEARDLARAGDNRLGAAYALGYIALIQAEAGRAEQAEATAEEALREDEEPGFAQHFVLTIAHLARAEAAKSGGHVAEAEQAAERAVGLSRRGAGRLEMALALIALADARHAAGQIAPARELLAEASAIVLLCADPGTVDMRLRDAEHRLARPRRSREPALRDELSDRELAVLRLLPSPLSAREIGNELFVSLNTVKTHIKAIYRKLGASSREDAVWRGRELRLL
jgi:LuxR family transcriptional regulator, maltose regulon positive regulatory protein